MTFDRENLRKKLSGTSSKDFLEMRESATSVVSNDELRDGSIA
jgi:hypothetical protein